MKPKASIESAKPVRHFTQQDADKAYVAALTPQERKPSVSQLERIAELPSELKSIFEYVSELVGKQELSNLVENYRIGEKLKSCKDDDLIFYKPLRKTTSLGALAHALGVSIRTLYDARKVAETFEVEEYGELIKLQPISWSHVRALAFVELRAQRQKLIRRVVENNLSVDELACLIEEIYQGPKKPRGPGRTPKPPRSVEHGLRKTVKISNAYRNVCDQALFSDAFDLPTLIHDTPPDKRTVAMREEIEAAISALEKVSAAANEKAQALRVVLPLCVAGGAEGQPESKGTALPSPPLRALPPPHHSVSSR